MEKKYFFFFRISTHTKIDLKDLVKYINKQVIKESVITPSWIYKLSSLALLSFKVNNVISVISVADPDPFHFGQPDTDPGSKKSA